MTAEHTILVVDDDESIRDSLSSFLEDEGHGVIAVRNGLEALEWLRQGGRPCLILLDWMMPIMDGEAFLIEQQQVPDLANIPVVVITAAGNAAFLDLQGRPLLPKPIQLQNLIGAVEQYC